MPALAVADALRADGARVVFVGGERAEKTLVPEAGYELRPIAVEGLSRTNPLKAARGVIKAAYAVRAAQKILRDVRPDAVMGGGGYVAGPVGAAAAAGRIPLVLTEADSHLGLTNKLLAGRAKRVCLAFPLEGREDPAKYLVTGRPVPPPFADRAAARAQFGLGAGDTCVLVFGGSLGARSINEASVDAFRDAPFRVLHACGRRDYEVLRERLGSPPPRNYDLREYISPFGPALAAADLTLARAGGSIFEVAAAGLPAVLVPYPHAAADHQTANARWMTDAGAAVVIRDEDVTPQKLDDVVGALLQDPAKLSAMAQASRALARPDAARDIANEVLAAAAAKARA
ncbi:UDP-N-acetylglucosamine--N-acetylmuramyl-(pentapeptide) pyrophosphoryl-undecaprenol N-acetylglucosamine transferase [Conexibacter woesei]|uniref:UDP-N-acetylglucosamine--N-acetylmuramyl- (pentapeptide) pyrophosphoryl-undecaprenol N-acetylglucosamine transferase n=1 Tax=Conexibacter woesei TaxID=191495 RepID=UPI000409DEDF|nr:UDP-N-acetylglucosamine--N-acetylmuramyl-(pentapeptide) pyrophosphoryl-undecaprenol N-acetylglucosamine transferase [Conexibacter woesei]